MPKHKVQIALKIQNRNMERRDCGINVEEKERMNEDGVKKKVVQNGKWEESLFEMIPKDGGGGEGGGG